MRFQKGGSLAPIPQIRDHAVSSSEVFAGSMLKPNQWHVLSVFFFVVVVSAVGFGFDQLLVWEGVSSMGVMLLSNILTGVVAGLLFLQNRLRAEDRQKLLEHRLAKVAEMNHHVRNALQVVSFYRHQISDPEAGRLLQESIRRIEWTLEEVLPRGWNINGAPLSSRAVSAEEKGPGPKSH